MGRIMDRVKRAAEKGGWESPSTKLVKRLGAVLSKDLVIQVLKNPASFNRKARRSVGLYLPLPGRQPARDPGRTRYYRRHADVLATIKASRNRRQRRHARRVGRSMERLYGGSWRSA